MSNRKYPVRGYWHSTGATFQHEDGMELTKLSRSNLLDILRSNKYGFTYYSEDSYKKSFTINKVGNYHE